MKCQRNKFSLQGKVSYLNCAYMSPMMKKVENAGIKGMKMKRKPYKFSPEDFFNDSETLRLLFAKLINGKADRVAIIPSVSYGFASVVKNLKKKKGSVLVASEQFPFRSNQEHSA